MKKIAIAAALLAISASAHAGTYTGYGSHHGERQLKVQTFHKDMSRMAMTKQEDVAPAAATDTTSAAAPAATPSDAAPAK
jgi:hypothetical protein